MRNKTSYIQIYSDLIVCITFTTTLFAMKLYNATKSGEGMQKHWFIFFDY